MAPYMVDSSWTTDLFPIHAAGDYSLDGRQIGRDGIISSSNTNALDRVISSYIPTIKSLS
jgi:hypothetical protein